MKSVLGKHVTRAWIRPGCERFPGGSQQYFTSDHPGFIPRRWGSSLDLPSLDTKWQKNWRKQALRTAAQVKQSQVEVAEKRPKQYILPMFPYPSGDLHLGHLRVYTISDVLSRFRRMQGYQVMHPIGWDAFGLPAENAALERGIDPSVWTKQNIEKMKQQMKSMNGHWDWDREFATCDPDFYKHTQRLFLLLHERGLAYQAKSLVNYDPVDKTVLANEQVDANGCSWRSGAKVEKKLLKQWFFKISAFRQELLDDLDHLAVDNSWPERVLTMQKHWLGKSTGARIKFTTMTYKTQTFPNVEVFTTRPDTIFGVQYLALASNHPIVRESAKTDSKLQDFLTTIPSLPPNSKSGYALLDIRAINPLAYDESTPDATKASLPIFVAPYVMAEYGDGAVMGVPGHDARDWEFWRQNRADEPIRTVIAPDNGTSDTPTDRAFVQYGQLTDECGQYAGLPSAKAKQEIIKVLESKSLGSAADTWRLRDWLVSRQRYWGTPIPIVHCKSCGAVPVPETELPVQLPKIQGRWGELNKGNALDHADDWVNTPCPNCGTPAKRDTDTMDTFVDSSWYFMRFPDPRNSELLFAPDAADELLPVDLYIGGVEHAILHLLYARFISKFIASTPLWPEGRKSHGEPFKKVLTQGMVHGKTYTDPANGRFLKPNELSFMNPSKPIITATGRAPNVSYEKMSKSKYNGVDPGTCIGKYGADATRAHILFQAPVGDVLEWDEEKIAGVTRWMHKIYEHIRVHSEDWYVWDRDLQFVPKLYLLRSAGQSETLETKPEAKIHQQGTKLWREVQATIFRVAESYGNTYSLNTVVSDLMSLSNSIFDFTDVVFHGHLQPIVEDHLHARAATLELIKMIAPIMPAFAEECWELLTMPYPADPLVKTLLNDERKTAPWFSEEKIRQGGYVGSIFEQAFPTTDGTYDMLAPSTRTCAVQVNGRLRCAVDIPVPPTELSSKALETWMTDQIIKTEIGRKRFVGNEDNKEAGQSDKVDIRRAKKIIVVRGGKTINYVL